MPIVEILDQRGFCYAAYHRLKIASVLDELALTVTRLAGYEGQSGELSAIRCFVQAWFELRYESDRRGETGGELRQNRFLYDFDFGYRARRLNFLQERVSQLLPLDRQATRILEQVPDVSAPAADAEADFRTALGRAKRDLNDEYVGLRSRAREVQRDEELQRAVRGLQIRPAELRAVLERAKDRGESVGRAKRILAERDLLDAFDHAARQLADAFGNILRDSSNRVRQQLAVPPDASAGAALALQVLRHLHEHFEDYDLVLFLTAYGQAEEADRVEVIRISPEDARSLIDETSPNDGRRKLAGVAVHHFGGFFDRAWRKNDIMWGRLDAAERLITTLLPEPHQEQVRNELLREAQLEIVREEFDTAGHNELLALLLQASLELRPRGSDQTDARVPKKENVRVVRSALGGVDDARLTAAFASTWTPEQILDFLGRGYEVDSTLDSLAMLGVAGRASQVTGSVLDGISEAAPIPWTSRWMIRVGRMLWGLAEVATPRSAPQLLWRYWSQLLLLIAATLILGGALFGNDGTSKAGWILVALTLAAKAVVWIASDLLGPRRAPSDGRFAWLRRGLAAVGRSLSTALGAVRLGVRWVAQRVLPVRIFLALLVAAVAGLLVLGAINVPEEANDLVKKLPDWLEDALRWIWPWDDGKGATSS
jgi:hypothetical protein